MSLREEIKRVREEAQEEAGFEFTNEFFQKCLAYSVRKYRFQAELGMHTLSEAEYLPLLLPDVIRESLFSEYTLFRYAEKGGEDGVRYLSAISVPAALSKCS